MIGKVLSPSALHINTITGAMRPAWGNPYGLKLRSMGKKAENIFIAEFGCTEAMRKALDGSPWMVGKHAGILREYDPTLKSSDGCFSKTEMWVHILILPFNWMDVKRGTRVAALIRDVVKVDDGPDGKVSGPFLRARVAIAIHKPLRRGVLLKTSKASYPEWFDIEFEKLTFFCYSCGLMGHMDLECPTPAQRNELGKLPYDVKLRAFEEKKKKPQSFGEAAAELFGSSGQQPKLVHRNAGQQGGSDRRGPTTDKLASQCSDAEG